MEIIIPCAGHSTRFPNLRPKYLLTNYSGKLMVEKAAECFSSDKNRLTIAILKEHDDVYNSSKILTNTFGNTINIVVLDNYTKGPADTVYQCLKKLELNKNEPFLVKDCDSFYQTDLPAGNSIHVSRLSSNPKIKNPAAKSFTISNNQDIILSIIEKKIVSDTFCVGGYQFERVEDYINAIEKLATSNSAEIFVSNVIDYLISKGKVFTQTEVSNYIDVGTAEDWLDYNKKPTYFCDIDGTIIKSKSDIVTYEPLVENIKILLEKKSKGCKIIFCTARPNKLKDITRTMLDNLGFNGCELIMEIHHSSRVLINDYAKSNPYPSAVAINLRRDTDNLGELI